MKFTILFDIIVKFVIQKLKNKHTFFKKYKNWGKLSSLAQRTYIYNGRHFSHPAMLTWGGFGDHHGFKPKNKT